MSKQNKTRKCRFCGEHKPEQETIQIFFHEEGRTRRICKDPCRPVTVENNPLIVNGSTLSHVRDLYKMGHFNDLYPTTEPAGIKNPVFRVEDRLTESEGQALTKVSKKALKEDAPIFQESKDYEVVPTIAEDIDIEEESCLSDLLIEYRSKKHKLDDSRELRKALKTIIELEEELSFYKDTADEFKVLWPAIPKSNYRRKAQEKDQYRVDSYALLSDVHPGKRITLQQTHGFNEFNPDIAQERLDYFWSNLGKLLIQQASVETIDTIHIVFGGDMIENRYMHPGEASEASMSAPEELAFMFRSCSDGIDYIHGLMKDRCRKIEVTGICGNHDRMANHRKTPHNNRTRESLATLLYTQLAWDFKGEDQIQFCIPEGEGRIFDSFGFRSLGVHGDNIKFSRANGLCVPSRDYREKKLSQFHVDFLFYGHIHNYFFPGSKFGSNGCVCGADSFSTDLGFGAQEPMQAYWAVSEKYGRIVQPTPIFLR